MHIIICITGVFTSLQIIVICIVIFLVSIPHACKTAENTHHIYTITHLGAVGSALGAMSFARGWRCRSNRDAWLRGAGAALQGHNHDGPGAASPRQLRRSQPAAVMRGSTAWPSSEASHGEAQASKKKLYFEHDIRSTPFVTNHQYYMSFHKA